MAMIAALAHGDGVKVLLSGEGADELFAGYDFLHGAEYRAVRAGLHPAAPARRAPPGPGRRAAPARRPRAVARAAPTRARRHRRAGVPAGVGRVGGRPRRGGPRARPWRLRAPPRPEGELEAALLGDLSTYLPHLLNRQDKNTMQASIETRVPFLDPAVVALALNLPRRAPGRSPCARGSCATSARATSRAPSPAARRSASASTCAATSRRRRAPDVPRATASFATPSRSRARNGTTSPPSRRPTAPCACGPARSGAGCSSRARTRRRSRPRSGEASRRAASRRRRRPSPRRASRRRTSGPRRPAPGASPRWCRRAAGA